jgi:hypothetical protein
MWYRVAFLDGTLCATAVTAVAAFPSPPPPTTTATTTTTTTTRVIPHQINTEKGHFQPDPLRIE